MPQPKPKTKPKRVPWSEFDELPREHWVKLYTERYGKKAVIAEGSDGARIVPDRVFENSRYTVFWCELPQAEGWPKMITLSIKHRERHPIRDWRDLQRIKNEVVGPENEAVEIFPAESRLVDTANQYHLWVLVDPKIQFPFGFQDRFIADGTGELTKLGTRQEPLENPPEDVIGADGIARMHDAWMKEGDDGESD